MTRMTPGREGFIVPFHTARREDEIYRQMVVGTMVWKVWADGPLNTNQKNNTTFMGTTVYCNMEKYIWFFT